MVKELTEKYPEHTERNHRAHRVDKSTSKRKDFTNTQIGKKAGFLVLKIEIRFYQHSDH